MKVLIARLGSVGHRHLPNLKALGETNSLLTIRKVVLEKGI
jgi:hypothetical protein